MPDNLSEICNVMLRLFVAFMPLVLYVFLLLLSLLLSEVRHWLTADHLEVMRMTYSMEQTNSDVRASTLKAGLELEDPKRRELWQRVKVELIRRGYDV